MKMTKKLVKTSQEKRQAKLKIIEILKGNEQ